MLQAIGCPIEMDTLITKDTTVEATVGSEPFLSIPFSKRPNNRTIQLWIVRREI